MSQFEEKVKTLFAKYETLITRKMNLLKTQMAYTYAINTRL